MDTGDTAWMLASTALVMIMLPGLALFYGGLVRRKNVLSTIMHSFFGLALVSVVWVLIGFSLAFGPDARRPRAHRRPRLRRLHERRPRAEHRLRPDHPVPAVRGVPADVRGHHARPSSPAPSPSASGSAPSSCSRSSGRSSSTRRSRTGSGRRGGWLFKLGALDFAGGTVVHISSGVSALIVAILIGRRAVNGESMEPHDVPDDRPRRGPAVVRLVRLQRRLGAERRRPRGQRLRRHQHRRGRGDDHLGRSRATSTRARSASSAPPAVRSPASSPSPPRPASSTAGGALIIGLVAGGLCYSATLLRARIKVDDALDVFAVHGVGGMFGAIATGVFATSAVQQLTRASSTATRARSLTQLVAVGATIGYAVVATFVIVKVVDVVLGIRVPSAQEETGLDLAVHGEAAYQP